MLTKILSEKAHAAQQFGRIGMMLLLAAMLGSVLTGCNREADDVSGGGGTPAFSSSGNPGFGSADGPGAGNSSTDDSGMGNSTADGPDPGDSGAGNSTAGGTGSGDGAGNSNTDATGDSGDSGSGDSGTGDPGMDSPPLGDPGAGDPGKTMPDGSFDPELSLDADKDSLIDIYTVAELNAIRYSLKSYDSADGGVAALNCGDEHMFAPCRGYELMANITFAPGHNWLPIGHCISDTKCLTYFDGIFDGNNHTIDGLSINLNAAEINNYYNRRGPVFGVGLFAGASGNAAFRNLRLVNARVATDVPGVGALVGQLIPTAYHLAATHPLHNLRLADSRIHGKIKVGGLFGYCRSCSVAAADISRTTVAATDEEAGILGGYTELSSLADVHISATEVSGSSYVGGMLGRSAESNLQEVRLERSAVLAEAGLGGGIIGDSTGDSIHAATSVHNNLSGHSYLGGLVGRLRAGRVSYSYAEEVRVVEEESIAGGLVGGLEENSEITDSVSYNNKLPGEGEEKGAMAGRASNSNIIRSYAYRGLVRGINKLGGLTGTMLGANTIRDSYARDLVITARPSAVDTFYAGGLAGYSYAELGSDLKLLYNYAALGALDFAAFSGSRVSYGGLLGDFTLFPVFRNSYWQRDFLQVGDLDILSYSDDLFVPVTSGIQLRQPLAATGIYAKWDDRDSVCPDGTQAWNFVSADEYPVLTCTPGGTDIQLRPRDNDCVSCRDD